MEKYAEKWMEGFCEETARLGLSKEATAELLQFAAMFDKAADPIFNKAYGETYAALVKQSAPLPSSAITLPGKVVDMVARHGGGLVKHPAGAAATTALGIGGLGAGYMAVAPKWNMGKNEQDMYWANKAYQAGLIDHKTLISTYNQLGRGEARSLRQATGYGMDERRPWDWSSSGYGNY